MNVKVYVNWEGRQLLSETEFNEMIADKVQKKINYDYELSYFLQYETSYSYGEVFGLTSKEKDEIYKEFQKYCEEEVESDVLNEDDWFEEFIEI